MTLRIPHLTGESKRPPRKGDAAFVAPDDPLAEPPEPIRASDDAALASATHPR
jgi:hypothetical protein